MLKAITLYEPWASLMAIGAKRNETRGCRTTHRGDIAIHVAKTDHGTPESLVPAIIHAYRTRNLQPDERTFGCIVAVVDLYDVQPTDRLHDDPKARLNMGLPAADADAELQFGEYERGRFFYRTHILRRLIYPVPCRGYQSIGWTVPADVEAKVREQLPKVFRLQCCSCGEPAPAFQQWWNRDAGYGICAKCFAKWVAKDGLESATECCGQPGIHHSL